MKKTILVTLTILLLATPCIADNLPSITSLDPPMGRLDDEIYIDGADFGEYTGDAGYIPRADINGNGIIDFADFGVLANAYGTSDEDADINHDGIVDFTDFSILANSYGKSRGTTYVEFHDGVEAKITSWSDTEIVCEVPYGAASGDVYVITDEGRSSGLYFELIKVPHLMRFQGTLGDGDEIPFSGTIPLESLIFRIYDVETGGLPLWEEEREDVSIQDGFIDVELGSVEPLNLAFDKQYWLGIEVEEDGEMTPRFKLTSVPYAFISEE